MCANSIGTASPANTRHVPEGAADHLAVSLNCQALYASSAWSGFIKAIDRQRVDGFLRQSVRHGYCSPDVPTIAEQCAKADEQYFEKICSNSTTCFTISFLHLELLHKTTTSDLEFTVIQLPQHCSRLITVRENVCNNLKNVKSHVFLDFEKNVKKRKKTYI